VQPGLAFKNNIVVGSYGATVNGSEDIQDDSSVGISFANNFCTNADAGKCTQTGDPKFVDTTLTSTTSLSLPNLNVQSGSNAVGNGTALTTAVGAGTNHSVLTVADAGYFQDGTAGSDLTRIYGTMVPDKIAIGTVSNIVEIEAVDIANNRIFLKHAMTWDDNANIWLYSKSDGMRVLNTAQDIGSHPYQIPVTYAPWVH
jgi:hypothetical protein